MYQDLLPDKLERLWKKVAEGLLSAEEFHDIEHRLLREYREEWTKALLIEGFYDLRDSTIHEISSYTGNGDLNETRRLCEDALASIKGEWHAKVGTVERGPVEKFYDQSEAMLYELMWWHTLVDDPSPLAYLVALKLAVMNDCESYLDFGCGVGSGGILFAGNRIAVTLADISSNMLKFSSWRLAQRGISAQYIDLKTGQLPESRFDFITAMDVFEHLVDPVATVRQLSGALKKGGFLFGRFHAEKDEDRPHHIVFDFEPTLRELKTLGFEKVWQDKWLWGHEVFQKT